MRPRLGKTPSTRIVLARRHNTSLHLKRQDTFAQSHIMRFGAS